MNKIIIKNTNLPNNKVTTVVMSTEDLYLKNRVEELGINVISTNVIKEFLPFEQKHADMQFLPINNNTALILENATKLRENLKKYYKNIVTCKISNINKTNKYIKYPYNIALNFTILNNKIIGKEKFFNEEIKKVTKNNFKILNTNQGYSKCSTAIVDNNSIITSDPSIYKVAINNKIDALKIKEGYINLPGVNHGFIGGCTGKLNKDLLAFTGNIKLHPDYCNIKDFCRNYNIYTYSLSHFNLLDIGGIIPIEELN